MSSITAAADADVQRVRAFMAVSDVSLSDLLVLEEIDIVIARRQIPDAHVHLAREAIFEHVKQSLRDELGPALSVEHQIENLVGYLSRLVLRALDSLPPA